MTSLGTVGSSAVQNAVVNYLNRLGCTPEEIPPEVCAKALTSQGVTLEQVEDAFEALSGSWNDFKGGGELPTTLKLPNKGDTHWDMARMEVNIYRTSQLSDKEVLSLSDSLSLLTSSQMGAPKETGLKSESSPSKVLLPPLPKPVKHTSDEWSEEISGRAQLKEAVRNTENIPKMEISYQQLCMLLESGMVVLRAVDPNDAEQILKGEPLVGKGKGTSIEDHVSGNNKSSSLLSASNKPISKYLTGSCGTILIKTPLFYEKTGTKPSSLLIGQQFYSHKDVMGQLETQRAKEFAQRDGECIFHPRGHGVDLEHVVLLQGNFSATGSVNSEDNKEKPPVKVDLSGVDPDVVTMYRKFLKENDLPSDDNGVFQALRITGTPKKAKEKMISKNFEGQNLTKLRKHFDNL